VVQGFASTLASRWDKLADADRRSAVQTIAERAGSLARLVEQLLLGSRAGADQLTVSNGQFDLGGVLRGAATAFRPLAGQHSLEADIPGDLPAAYGDAMATDIIVGQLLENAFKYSPEGGTVTIAARRAADRVEVTVADEGIGIPPADLERVFERFVQGETGDRRRFGGIGLGLYIVRQLARAMGAEVAAEVRPSGGTLMRLRLRLTEPPGSEAGPVQAGLAEADTGETSSVDSGHAETGPAEDSSVEVGTVTAGAIAANGTSASVSSDAQGANGRDVEFPRSDIDGLRLPRPRPASDPPGDD
jgi:K+-sensing histidine kinase KdpD